MLGWMKHKLESRLLGGISITSNTKMMTTLMVEGKEELKSLWREEGGGFRMGNTCISVVDSF